MLAFLPVIAKTHRERGPCRNSRAVALKEYARLLSRLFEKTHRDRWPCTKFQIIIEEQSIVLKQSAVQKVIRVLREAASARRFPDISVSGQKSRHLLIQLHNFRFAHAEIRGNNRGGRPCGEKNKHQGHSYNKNEPLVSK